MGFLGVGKTTAIKQLLAHKPQDERWAVLVNEFGEIGVDGTLIRNGVNNDIAVRQIPGGCMCCAAGPVTQVTLNNLLRQERPDRLLLEPSGLGHPAEILRLLRAPEYQGVLQVRDVITLLDPRHVIQPRYQEHRLFKEQLRVAEQVVLNKIDLCDPADLALARTWLNTQLPPQTPRHEVEQGKLSM
ncbi:MAG: GTP-binding protein, partial [Natronospirillum sp.]